MHKFSKTNKLHYRISNQHLSSKKGISKFKFKWITWWLENCKTINIIHEAWALGEIDIVLKLMLQCVPGQATLRVGSHADASSKSRPIKDQPSTSPSSKACAMSLISWFVPKSKVTTSLSSKHKCTTPNWSGAWIGCGRPNVELTACDF